METPKAKSQSSNLPSSNVRVVLRVRPFLPTEIQKDRGQPSLCVSVLEQVDEEVTVHLKDQWTSRNECYKLDSFFGQDDAISQIFHKDVSSVIPGIFHGLNATVFAYGATGSGKTYTMQGTENEPGLICLSMSAILSLRKGMQSSVNVSFYEVYMDRCYDLLEPKAKEIMALDDKNGRVQLKGLSWVPVKSMDEFCEVLSTGVQRRKVAHTSLNDVSSRSHAVLAIEVRNGAFKGKLNLIDLAGNEDNRRTCNEGIRLQESAKINKSLFALSNVIYALNNNEPRVPYRESKLTRILQDSLGGDSRALMIACLNPGSYQEAIHTVSLAARSRQIVNYVGSAQTKETPREVVDMEAKLRAWLESKGKTKSIQRMNGIFSPPLHRTPASICYSRNEKVSPSNKGRKLLDFGGDTSHTHNVQVIVQDDDFSSNSLVIPKDVNSKESMGTRRVTGCSEQQKVTNNNHKDETCINGNMEDTKDLQEKTSERIRELQSPLRKALSPIKPCNNQISGDYEANTPVSEYVANTPIDKFNVLSSNLKESLVEEYMSFLNIASKPELMQLKGIGKKRAECIVELRERSPGPIKSLSDLEKIGLSSKQVHELLKRGARGIFT